MYNNIASIAFVRVPALAELRHFSTIPGIVIARVLTISHAMLFRKYFTPAFVPPNSMNLHNAPKPAS